VFANAVAPALLVAQAIGRIGNYFNQELFGKPTSLPWGLEITLAHRPGDYTGYSTFQPTFLYELIFDLALAAALVWLGHHRQIRPWGLFALYVAGYSAFRIFEESVRIDSSEHFLGLRLNFFVACLVTLVGLGWFALAQRGGMTKALAGGDEAGPAAGPGDADPGGDSATVPSAASEQ
jgi:prolipoprotein diacylglyceryl transferase